MFVSVSASFCGCFHVCIFVSLPPFLFLRFCFCLFLILFDFVSACFYFCFCYWESPLGILFVFSFRAIAARSTAHRRRRWGAPGSLGPPVPGDPSQHLTAGTRTFYAFDSRNTDVLCTARANQGRRKQPAGLKNFVKFRENPYFL